MSDHLEGSLSKFFNVEKRNSLLTQNQLHARATDRLAQPSEISLDNQAGHGSLVDPGCRFNQPRTMFVCVH